MIRLPAPKGNKFALGNKGGRPTTYPEDLPQKLIEYFDIEVIKERAVKVFDKKGNLIDEQVKLFATALPTIEKFCKQYKIADSTFYDWVNRYEELSEALKICKTMQKALWQEASMLGLYDRIYTIFMGKNVFGWVDKQEITVDDKRVIFEGEDKIPD